MKNETKIMISLIVITLIGVLALSTSLAFAIYMILEYCNLV